MEDIVQRIVPILKKGGVTRAALFGSFARGEHIDDSDIDILIEFGDRKSLFDFLALQHTLEDLLQRKVDLVTYRALHPYLKDRILAQQKMIYGERF